MSNGRNTTERLTIQNAGTVELKGYSWRNSPITMYVQDETWETVNVTMYPHEARNLAAWLIELADASGSKP